MAINQNNVAFAQEAIEKILYTNGAIVGGGATLQEGIQNGDAVSAAIAVMRKLLVICYGVLKSGQAFDVDYVKKKQALRLA